MSVANSSVRPGSAPTSRELEVLRAWIDKGNARLAARDLGVTEAAVDAALANVRARAGVRRTWEAVFIYMPYYPSR